MSTCIAVDTEPVIGGGQCVPQPEVIPTTDTTVMIGSSAYIVDGYDLTVTCNVTSGTSPVNISWYRNGVLDSSKQNMPNITIPNMDFTKIMVQCTPVELRMLQDMMKSSLVLMCLVSSS